MGKDLLCGLHLQFLFCSVRAAAPVLAMVVRAGMQSVVAPA